MNRFFGTIAPLTAEVTLAGSLLVMAILTVGALLAWRKRYVAHRWVQTVGVTLNLVLVVAVMLSSFAKAVVPGLPQRIAESYYAIGVLHGLVGLVAVTFGVFVMLRGHGLVPKALKFRNYKAFMRTAYGLYLFTTLVGVALYSIWYAPAPAADAQPVAVSAPNAVVVPMVNLGFDPREIVVPVGATIEWINQDGVRHNVVADDGTLFRSELLARGERFTTTFAKQGLVPYYCELHGAAGGTDMAGTIRVVPADQAPTLAAQPTTAPLVAPTAELAGVALPTQARTAIVQLIDEGPGLPEKQGYVTGLRNQADELLLHATFVQHAQQTGDVAGVRRHAEHVYNLIVGSLDPTFGDLNSDGHSQNPGDGFGLLTNGAQIGYIQATINAAQAAADASDATDAIKLHAGHVRISAENMRGWTTEARDLALAMSKKQGNTTAQAADKLVQLSEQIARGVDLNGDGEIAPVTGEGGALVASEHAHYMAGLDVK